MNRQLIYSTKKLIPQEKKIDPGIKTYLPVAEKQKLSCHHETLPLTPPPKQMGLIFACFIL
jgi:hypothetical protein